MFSNATYPLGEEAAKELGYTQRLSTESFEKEWIGPKPEKILKFENWPRIIAQPEKVWIFQKHYDVTFFVSGSLDSLVVNGVRIFQWPTDPSQFQPIIDILSTPLWMDHPKLFEAWRERYLFLRDNPGYRKLPSKVTNKKKVYASQLEV